MSGGDELHRLTIARAARLVKARKLSPVEYLDALLGHIAALDPQLNAFITVTGELARAQARRVESEIMHGRYRGPLHGIPYALKDVYNTKGVLTSCGSRLCIDNVPADDAAATRALLSAGAVLVGKLQTHEFAHGGPSFDLPWPPARNPWNTAHFTGGSSSGAGSAISAGLVPAALGTDTGGSIRGPASLCGIVGYKPTFGLVSRAGVIPNSFTMDHCGPMARTVEDCAILLQAIVGFDQKDAGSIAVEVPDYRDALACGIRGLRIGVLRHCWEEDSPAHPELASAMEAAIEVYAKLGARIEDCRVRPGRDLRDIKTIIGETEIYSIHYKDLKERPGDFGRDFLGRILPACLFHAADYVQASREHRRVMSEMRSMYERYDVLLTTGAGPAPRLDAHKTSNFWQKPNVFTLANVTGGPALALPAGFSSAGLPLGMQIIGRPFDDAGVLRVGYAYQQATNWHTACPMVEPGASPPAVFPKGNDPDASGTDAETRGIALNAVRRAGLTLNDHEMAIMLECAPFALAMSERIRKPFARTDEPALVLRVPL